MNNIRQRINQLRVGYFQPLCSSAKDFTYGCLAFDNLQGVCRSSVLQQNNNSYTCYNYGTPFVPIFATASPYQFQNMRVPNTGYSSTKFVQFNNECCFPLRTYVNLFTCVAIGFKGDGQYYNHFNRVSYDLSIKNFQRSPFDLAKNFNIQISF